MASLAVARGSRQERSLRYVVWRAQARLSLGTTRLEYGTALRARYCHGMLWTNGEIGSFVSHRLQLCINAQIPCYAGGAEGTAIFVGEDIVFICHLCVLQHPR